MGLDMYLTAKRYLSRWDHSSDDERDRADRALRAAGLEELQTEHGSGVVVEATAITWRKANAIHGWFVDHVQGGVDDCREHYVDRARLEELRDACAEAVGTAETRPAVLEVGRRFAAHLPVEGEPIMEPGEVVVDPTVAEALLPTRKGFFFGGTRYDGWYLDGLRRTVVELDRVLGLDDSGVDFYYRSSW